MDFERWKNFHKSLKETIVSWKDDSGLQCGDPQALQRNNVCSSKEADIGRITSSLSSAMGSITPALSRLLSTRPSNYLPFCRPLIERVYTAFQGNRDICYSFLQHCADYGKMVIDCRPSSIASPMSFPVLASHDLRVRTTKLSSEISNRSVENTTNVGGPRKFKAAYKKALPLEQKMASELDTLLEMLVSWASVIDGHGVPGEVALKRRRKLWQKTRDSIRTGLATLDHEPVACMSYAGSAPLASTPPRSRWTKNRRNVGISSLFGWVFG